VEFRQFFKCQAPPHKRKDPLLKSFWQQFWGKSSSYCISICVISLFGCPPGLGYPGPAPRSPPSPLHATDYSCCWAYLKARYFTHYSCY